MPAKARRRPPRRLLPLYRRALLVVCLWQAGAAAGAAPIDAARYDAPTDRYPHGVLGDETEYGALVLSLADGRQRSFILPDSLVFEDTAPRLADLDGDAAPEVIVVESHQARGARLAVWGPEGRIAATPHIGTRFRWLAPVGAADLDGDGQVEIAYVDRPHLLKTLRIWRYADGALTEVATFPGVTNHRIGETDIAGGLRDCAGGPEIIVADSGWQSMLALRFDGSGIEARRIGTDTGRAAFARALSCR